MTEEVTVTSYDAETAGAAVCADPGEMTGNAAAESVTDKSRDSADKSRDGADKSRDTAPTAAKAAEKATYTADEVRALLQSEGDRRVAGAKKKWEKETEEKIAASAEEMARTMTDSLRAEADGLRRALGEAEAEMASRERELALMNKLGERGLPKELLPMILPTEAGTESDVIDAICRVIDGCAKREVEARLRSSAPAAASGKHMPTADEVRTLPVAKLAELMR